MSKNGPRLNRDSKSEAHHDNANKEQSGASPEAHKHTDSPQQDSKKPNWVEKGTLIILGLTFAAACYAGYEATRLADLTQTLVSEGADATATQLRAYVGVVKVELVSDSSVQNGKLKEGEAGYIYPNSIKMTLKNFGATTAFYVSDYMSIAALPFATGLPDNFKFPDVPSVFSLNLPHPVIESGTLDHEQTFADRHVLRDKDFQIFRAAGAKEKLIYIWGHIYSCDIYNRKWVRDYAFVYLPWNTDEKFEPIGRHQSDSEDGNCQYPR